MPSSHVCQLPNGLKIQVDPNDAIGRSIYLYGCYEYAVTRLIEDFLDREMTFFDVGANIGYYTLLAASRCEQVVAFEPVPAIYQALTTNIARNGVENVTAVNSAVGENEGELELFVPTGDNAGLASLEPIDGAKQILTTVVTLDEIVRCHRIDQVDLIKIDIEGAEVRAFEGGRELLVRAEAPDVVFEAHPASRAAEWLRDYGYTIYGFRRQRDYEAPNLFASKHPLTSTLQRHLQL